MAKREELRETIIAIIIFAILIFVLFYVIVPSQPNGHYEGTETKQPDGNYYIWVEDKEGNYE